MFVFGKDFEQINALLRINSPTINYLQVFRIPRTSAKARPFQ